MAESKLPAQTGLGEVSPESNVTEVQQVPESTFQLVDLNHALPDLDKANVLDYELASEYWEPEVEGETRRGVLASISVAEVEDKEKPGETKRLTTATFHGKRADGSRYAFSQASTLLVADLSRQNVPIGTPLSITYVGVHKFNNGHKGHKWSIKPLLIQV